MIFKKKKDNNDKIIMDILLNNMSLIQLNNIEKNAENYINYTINKKDMNSKYNVKNRNKIVLLLKELINYEKIIKSNINIDNKLPDQVISSATKEAENEIKTKSKKGGK